MNPPSRLLYCHCSRAKVLPAEATAAALGQLCASGLPFLAVPDLCELAARRDPQLAELSADGAIRVAACHPRAVRWLLAVGGAGLSPDQVDVIDLRALAPVQLAAALTRQEDQPAAASVQAELRVSSPEGEPVRLVFHGKAAEQGTPPEVLAPLLSAVLEKGCSVSSHVEGRGSETRAHAADVRTAERAFIPRLDGHDKERLIALIEQRQPVGPSRQPSAWLAWFPVIDFDRCTHCMQCLSFCLFDVFGVSAEGRILVRNSANCKTNCPACSRVCPEAAILFPKHPAAPINGGEAVQGTPRPEKTKVDISLLLGGDLYATLRARQQQAAGRFSKDRDPALALEERRKCLAQLAQAADIPPEVLMALPSPEEIQRRAQEAAAKARAALELPRA